MMKAAMTGRKNRALEVPLVAPYKALGNFPKALYGTTGGTCSARFFRPLMAAAMWIILQFKGCLPRWKGSARNISASER